MFFQNNIQKDFKKMLKKMIKTLACLVAFSGINANAGILVDLELQLLADVSGSVSSSEYALQLNGYENAFRDTDVINAILSGDNGGIAVQYIEWSSSGSQSIQINWTLIDSAASALAFADTLLATTRAFSGGTNINNAIDFGVGLFASNSFDSARQVMDVSGDGDSSAAATKNSRDAALAAGIDTINGITIGAANGLSEFYQDNVIGGVDAFHVHAATFADFNAGIKTKLKREITSSVPEPSTIVLFGLAIMGLFGANRKQV